MKGYAGKILRVDLTHGTFRIEPLDETLCRDYLGGRGFAARLIYDEVKGAEPLGPDNKLVLASGPFSGVFVPAGAKATFAAKSPATGIYGDANIGGHLAAEMKYAGYDAIIFEGQAPSPVYLYVDGLDIQLRPAKHLWGQGTITAEQVLKASLGDEFQIAAIGPAGENQVFFACIGHDIGRQAGRTGVGAVMGSKNLKAIAIRGEGGVDVADLDKVRAIGREMILKINRDPGLKIWHEYGLTSVTTWADSIGAFPTRNYRSGHFESVENIGHEAMRERIFLSTKACFGCPMACGKFTEVKERGIRVEGPEYETVALIGGNCGMDRIEDVAYLNQVCDELGLDTISAGNAIAFAIECYQRGVITSRDTDGLTLRFGDADTFATLAGRIARREGIGDTLANGVKYAAAAFGQGSDRYAIQVKGLEWSGYEARGAPAMMLAYATCDIGAHHNRAWAITHDIAAGRDLLEGKAEKVIELQHIRPLFDCLGACRLQWVEMGLDLKYYADIYPAITGVDATWDDLIECSERVFNLTRMYAIRELPGFGRSADYPPARFMEEPVASGETRGRMITREQMDWLLDKYYDLRGWDSNGIPTAETLRRLRLAQG